VHPGQQSFFSEPRTAGGFDYDCDGNAEPEFSDSVDCALLSLDSCDDEGFLAPVPACGNNGTWVRCSPTVGPLPLLCTTDDESTRKLACH
jgi:hypothetical protein